MISGGLDRERKRREEDGECLEKRRGRNMRKTVDGRGSVEVTDEEEKEKGVNE